MLLPESTELVGFTGSCAALEPAASESCTSTKSMAFVADAPKTSDHWLPGLSEARLMRSSASRPSKVKVPLIVCVAVLSKVRVTSVLSFVLSVFVKLLKMVEPVSV